MWEKNEGTTDSKRVEIIEGTRALLMISKLNILINPCTKNNKLLGIVEVRVESSGIGF